MENNTETMKKLRIEYIDAMRGFAMILVVYYHIINGVFSFESEFNEICVIFRMPLFFFISGLLSYSPALTPCKLKQRCFNRLFGQLTPTIVICLIYIFVSGHNFIDVIFDPTKYGYWFTIAMFEAFTIFAITTFFLEKLKASSRTRLTTYIFLIVLSHTIMSLLTRYGSDITKSDIWRLTSIGQGILYLKYFLFGVICKLYYDKFIKLAENQYAIASAIILFIILQFFNFAIASTCQGFLGAFIVYCLFHHYKNYFNNSTVIGKQLSIIGKNTLEIYLIHFILLYGIMGLHDCPQFINLISENSIIEIIAITILSIVIIIICLLIAKFFKISNLLYSILFGFKK